MVAELLQLPLSLYIHVPWCVRKCPYCDFNSHALRGELPESDYVEALLRDLELDLPRVWGRRLHSVFLGGGTPSLLSPDAVDRLLAGVRARLPLAPNAEITLEANPGASDIERFAGYRAAGVNRLSIGIQSFDNAQLAALGRIHGRDEALRAAEAARLAGFANFNLDLMFGLPGQSPEAALADVRTAMALAPTHLSVYQLTLEPNTPFHAMPPPLPNDDTLAAMQEAIEQTLASGDFIHYEVSAYAKSGQECAHNRNYWEFGDYLGIGAGAHGKITGHEGILRLARRKQPQDYLAQAGTLQVLAETRRLTPDEAAFEFMLNALRLVEGVPLALFSQRTGLPLATVESALEQAIRRGMLEERNDVLRPTVHGQHFLNDLIGLFLPTTPSFETR
jgi:putative oxygen-independent coproporphyrinogen III oxidase